MSKNIDVILVTFNPDLIVLLNCIHSIDLAVRNIWVVDNGSKNYNSIEKELMVFNKIKLISLDDNFGIAYAQNVGIKKAKLELADYVILSDQDTLFPGNYVEDMMSVFDYGDRIIGVAPMFSDLVSESSKQGFVRANCLGFYQFCPNSGSHEILQAIASGMVIDLNLIDCVGLMNEQLFIDWVDIEWCWRVKQRGFLIFGNADVVIEHCLGDESISILRKSINLRSSTRHYYITRNAFYLAFYSKYLNPWFRVLLFFKGLSYIVGFSALSKPRLINFRMTIKGMFHGLTAKLGRYCD